MNHEPNPNAKHSGDNSHLNQKDSTPQNKTNYEWRYDNTADAGYLRLQPEREGGAAKTIQLTDQLNLDLDEDGEVYGVEFIGIPQNKTNDVYLEEIEDFANSGPQAEALQNWLRDVLVAKDTECERRVREERREALSDLHDELPELDDNDLYRAEKDKIQRGYNIAYKEVYDAITRLTEDNKRKE